MVPSGPHCVLPGNCVHPFPVAVTHESLMLMVSVRQSTVNIVTQGPGTRLVPVNPVAV
jgi:hypothetical protein